MTRLYKYIFYRIYLFYKDKISTGSKTHIFAAVMLGLIFFGHLYLAISIFNYLIFGDHYFDDIFFYYVLIGNAIVLNTVIVVSNKQKYKKWIDDSEKLSIDEVRKIRLVSVIICVIGIMSVFAFMYQSFTVVR